jgi:hypothetical protein
MRKPIHLNLTEDNHNFLNEFSTDRNVAKSVLVNELIKKLEISIKEGDGDTINNTIGFKL